MLACGVACLWKLKDCHSLKKAHPEEPQPVFHVEEDSLKGTSFPKEGNCNSVIYSFGSACLLPPSRYSTCCICRPPCSLMSEGPCFKPSFFHKLHFHGILGCGLIVLQLHAQSSFLLMLFFFSTYISFLRWLNIWSLILNSLGRAKGASFSSSLASLSGFRRYNFLASKQGNRSYLHEKNHRDDRASPPKILSV